MDSRQYKFFVYQFLCFLVTIYVINLSNIVRSESISQSDSLSQKSWVQKVEGCDFLLKDYIGMEDNQPDSPFDAPELTELEQDYDFTNLFSFAPLRLSILYLITGNVPFRPEHNLAHFPEISAPPPQLNA
ncbi:hypothetical protein [Spirosoma sp.]|uniref:hypothetical protein n=1 Tax=Spirosoma sp. TaxID=1899569 RepID=UPI003B3AD838